MRAEGFNDSAIRAATSHLYRIRRGAYGRHHPKDAAERHRLNVIAVILRWKGEMVASHVSAAILHGCTTTDVDLRTVHVTYADGCLRRGGRHEVRSHDGPAVDGDLVEVVGIPVTNHVRTLVDCARILPLEQSLVLADHALHVGWVDADALRARVSEWAGMNGIEGARQMVHHMDGRSESPGETRTRLILSRAGIRVEPQVVINEDDGSFVARVDLKVADAAVVVEFDGRKKYSTTADIERAHWQEKQRADRLRNLGYEVVRVTWRDLANPRRIERWVKLAIGRSR